MAKAREIENVCADTVYRIAIARLIETRFDEMMVHREGTLAGKDPEALHDMRVASRRLRAAMDVAGGCFPKKFRKFHKTVKQLTDVLGGVRDHDVLRGSLTAYRNSRPSAERPAINAMLQASREAREPAREQLIEFFNKLEDDRFDPRFRKFFARYSHG